MGFKKCPKCGIMLSASKFGCNKSRSDGMQPYCILCMRKARKSSSKSDKSRELAKERQKRYRERLKKKEEKKVSIKVSTKKQDSVTNGIRKHNDSKVSRGHKITLNPQPVKKNGD